MKLMSLLSAALIALAHPLLGQADNPVAQAKTKLDKWVETQQLISEEKNEWAVEKEILEDTRQLLEDELETLEAKIDELKADSTEADKQRDGLLMQRVDYIRAQKAMEDKIRELELKMLDQIKRFPKPLQETLEAFIVRIPEDPEKAKVSLSDRTLNIVAILSQTERFNRDVHLHGETEKLAGDEAIQVWRIYWGLAGAYYVDDKGTRAGVGLYGDEGWDFQENNSLAGDLDLLRNIKEGTEDEISFIQLPATVR